jgi:hypothetical protein
VDDFNARDLFAGLAMVGMLASDTKQQFSDTTVAELAYAQADAMLKEKAKRDDRQEG